MSFEKLREGYTKYVKFLTKKKFFEPSGTISNENVLKSFNFAWEMAFGSGKHRDRRSGGTHARKAGEIFANTFQGKLSEFAAYQELSKRYPVNLPDITAYGLGVWDALDFKIFGKKISVKSTKRFGNLMLLEKTDWNENAEYIPDMNERYDFFLLIRLGDDPEWILKQNRCLYSEYIDRDSLWNMFAECQWDYDIPGFITRDELIRVINDGFILWKGDKLNGKTTMDATNYYVQAGDMHPLQELNIE